MDIAALCDYSKPDESEAHFRAALPGLAGDQRLEVLARDAWLRSDAPQRLLRLQEKSR